MTCETARSSDAAATCAPNDVRNGSFEQFGAACAPYDVLSPCLLELLIRTVMPVRLHHVVVDAHDLTELAQFWAEALGWSVLSAREREVVVGPTADAPVGLCFMPAGSTRKTVKNRLHLDLTTEAGDRAAEIERLIALGARRVDVGQTGEESWDVLADPEGNEFCVVRPKVTLVG